MYQRINHKIICSKVMTPTNARFVVIKMGKKTPNINMTYTNLVGNHKESV